MTTKLKRTISMTLALVTMLSAMAGCSGSPSSSTAGSPSGSTAGSTTSPASGTTKEDPIVIEWLAYQPSAQPDPNSEVVKRVEEMFNAKFNFWYIDDQQWDETLNVKLAGGTMPDVIRLKNVQALPSYIKQGVVDELPLSFIAEKAPTYYKLVTEADTNKVAWDLTSFEGKNYGFIGLAKDGEYAPIMAYRQDWMEKLGVKEPPKTLAEFEKLMYAFRNDDPDGNGKKDTYGISNRGIRAVLGAYGIPYNDDEKEMKILIRDGVPVYAPVQPEAKEALALLQKWYKDGIIDPEYITGENTGGYWGLSHAFINGKIGVSSGPFYHFNPPLTEGTKGGQNYEELKAVTPTATIVSALAPTGPAGLSGMAGSGPFREPIVITTQAKKDPRKVEVIMAMLEKMYADDEYAKLIRYGIEGVDFNIVNGELKTSDAIKGLNNTRVLGHQVFNFLCVPPKLQESMQPAKYAYADKVATGPYYPQINIPTTDITGKYANTLWTLTVESYAKIITGEVDINYFDTYVTEWNKQGGEASTKSLQETYAAMKSK